jgi:hypothetical protein
MKRPAFREALEEAQLPALEVLKRHQTEAAMRLASLLQSSSEAISLRACLALLGSVLAEVPALFDKRRITATDAREFVQRVRDEIDNDPLATDADRVVMGQRANVQMTTGFNAGQLGYDVPTGWIQQHQVGRTAHEIPIQNVGYIGGASQCIYSCK